MVARGGEAGVKELKSGKTDRIDYDTGYGHSFTYLSVYSTTVK